ncbi:uncharacterized protein LOC121860819 [Homarus americanus]|uniref:uncharacterized protein LOC121860819 n=1 Tax=Homarus americanus TaxID=6706 RepID=UPI001C465321|nr:uncharacterized protein LOC121860819 [Homarus americanus]
MTSASVYVVTSRPPSPTHMWWAVVTAWLWLTPVVSGQYGLLAPAFLSLRSDPGVLLSSSAALRSGAVPSTLLTKLGERPPLPRRSASTRESEIAAIFRGVAYGAPTQGPNSTSPVPPTTTTTTTTTSTTTTTPTTTPREEYRPWAMEDGGVEVVGLPHNTVVSTAAGGEVSYVLHDATNVSDDGEAPPRPSQATILMDDTATVPAAATIATTEEGVRGWGERETTPLIVDMSEVRWWLGAAWWVHVYVSAGLLALLAAAALCCMVRSTSGVVLPRPHYLGIHTLVFLAAALRSLHLFHDPYGVERRLPEAAAAAVEETSWPCLTAALAVLVVVLARAGGHSRPTRPHATLVLTLMTALHLSVSITAHLAAHLLVKYALPLRVVARAVTATWGGGVGGGGVWAGWRAETWAGGERGQLLARVTRWGGGATQNSGLQRGARLALVASVAQIVLAILQLYILVAPLTPAAHVWAWWTRVSLARGLELVVGVAVVTAAGLLAQGRPAHARHDTHIFSVLTSCGREARVVKGGRSANVFPASSEKQHILGSFTLRPAHHTLDHTVKRPPLDWASPDQPDHNTNLHSVTSDFQLLWNRERTQSATTFRPPSMLVNDSGFVRFRTQVDPEQAMDDVFNQSSLNLRNAKSSASPYIKTHHNYSSQTLPSTRYYCGPVTSVSSPERSPIRKPIRSHTTRGRRAGSRMGQLRPVSPTQHHLTLPASSASRYDVCNYDDYEVAPYYHHHSGSVSGSSNMYATPHANSPRRHYSTLGSRREPLVGVHTGRQLTQDIRVCQPSDALSGVLEPSTCSSLSEIHVDYLTDVSSSNDGVSQGSLPFPCQRPRRHHHLLTLPLTSTHYAHSNPTHTHSHAHKTPSSPPSSPSHQPDVTPDSAVVLDYCSSGEEEGEETADPRESQQQGEDLMRLSSTSLSSEVKGQAGSRSGLLSKLVGSSMSVSCYGYSPLDVDDTSSPSQETPATAVAKVRRVASSSDLQEVCEASRTTSTLPRPPDTVTSL